MDRRGAGRTDEGRAAASSTRGVATDVVALDDPRARQTTIVGAKASALAVAMANGMPVLPGAVLTTAAVRATDLRAAWSVLSNGGRQPVAVRSSSTVEDQSSSSMAGQFVTVLDVHTWPATIEAVEAVRASARGAPMAVLVQPMCDAVVGGVLFGVDPVGGRRDRLVVELVPGTPQALVSGEASASRVVLTRRGRQTEASGDLVLSRASCRRLAALARDAERLFGGPQDIEWVIDGDERLWLLQSRPVTATAAVGVGPRLGPGPIAETFPEPLSQLELDLWVPPLRVGVREALRILGAHPRAALEQSPVFVEVGGRVAADLDLLEGRRRGRLAFVDPRPGARRLAAAWRIGRLRRALPLLAADVVGEVDRRLAEVPRLRDLDEAALLRVVGQCRLHLRTVHGYEVLAGALAEDDGATGVAHALAAVTRGRIAGLDDGEIARAEPVALALVAPAIHPRVVLPAVPATGGPHLPLGPREALRLRARWLQELSARAVLALGDRLAATGHLEDAITVRWLSLAELVEMVESGRPAPPALFARIAADPGAPLPVAFRLSERGAVVPEVTGDTAGRGAGGGRGIGPVAGPDDDRPGTVLVVRTLEPGLAARLAGRAGLVAETGSVLSHLAIVARELGVPTVVGVPAAVERFPAGTVVVVDGHTGVVEVQP